MPLTYVPEVIDHPSPNRSPRVFDTKKRPGTRVDTVLIHHTATAGTSDFSRDAAVRWLCQPGSGVSAHYVVGRGGEVARLVPERLKAWHAGKGRLPWETCPDYDFNHRSIGIEVVNPGDGKTPFTEAQYRALEWLVPDVCKRLGGMILMLDREHKGAIPTPKAPVPLLYVLGHRDVAPGRKTDPADNFDWARIRQALAGGVA